MKVYQKSNLRIKVMQEMNLVLNPNLEWRYAEKWILILNK